MRRWWLGGILGLASCGNEIKVYEGTEDPLVSFVVPGEGATFDPRTPVTVCANLTGGREPFEISLTSNVDGVLATTADFAAECPGGNLGLSVTLSDGEHQLELTVTDSVDRQASDTVGLTSTDNDVPTCTVTAPTAGVVVGTVRFEARFDDEEPADVSLSLVSDLDGEVYSGPPTGNGRLSLDLEALSVGEHLLTLVVTDTRGADGECTGGVTVAACVDFDEDGVTTCDDDCDDADDSVYPGAPEDGNGVDDDCDGVTDEGTALYDDDEDGFTELDGDCDDDDDNLYPGAAEIADDGIDQDCDGDDTVTCFDDRDEDGAGRTVTVLAADGDCNDVGESATDDDCDDTDDTIYPGAIEVLGDGIDQDCDGSDVVGCYEDLDDDGFGSAVVLSSPDGDCNDFGETAIGGDCNDGNGNRYPGAPDTADDGIDQDCNGTDTVTCQVDGDLDTFGGGSTLLAPDGDCVDAGESTSSTDCNDNRATVYPGATEIPDDGVDQDCTGADARTCQVDADFDGFGTPTTLVSTDADCTDPGESTDTTDCHDGTGTIFPGAPEVADDGIDQDCNATDTVTCRVDNDRDTFGATTTLLAVDGECTDPGESTSTTDCDDNDAARYPGAVDLPNDGIDQDCTGADLVECWVDADGDGYGNDQGLSVPAADGDCDDAGESTFATDCDDADATVSPAGVDAFGDGMDQDCDGIDGADIDADGYAGNGGPDCDDSDSTVNPGASERRNTLDDDCDASCDEGLVNAGDLVITELMINPDSVSDANAEWFEVYNRTGIDIALCSGWSFADSGTNLFTVADPTLVIPAGGYAVFGIDGNSATNGGYTPDYVFSSGQLQLGNSGDELVMAFDGSVIDEFTWSSAFDPVGASMQAEAGKQDAVSNDTESNWCPATTSMSGGDEGTPGLPPDC